MAGKFTARTPEPALRLLAQRPISENENGCPRAISCDPEEAMKILLGILAVLAVAAFLFADYKWRQWMAARRRDRQ